MTTKCTAEALEVGEHISTTVYYTVVGKQPGKVQVKDSATGDTLTISDTIIERESYSALQYPNGEVKISRTEAVKVLQNAGDTIFKVVFMKKDGSLRELIGIRIPGVPGDTVFGRTECWEVVEGGGYQRRQVDHRTIKSIIWKGTLYSVK